MRNMSCVVVAIAALVLSLGAGTAAVAQEHPEHPEKASKEHPEHPEKASKEHPEHPEKASKEHPEHPETVEITKDSLADAIQAYLKWDAKLHGGYLFVHDKKEGATLALTLEKVHRDKLASLGHGVYFACADFKATNGSVYDLDVVMEASPGSRFHGLAPTEIAVHKRDGKARYTWYEEGGVWKKKMK